MGREYGGVTGTLTVVGVGLARNTEAQERIRTRLAEHADLFCDQLVGGVRGRQRWAMNLYPRIMGLVGGNPDIENALLAMLGIGSIEVARRALDITREAENEDEASLYERALSHVQDYRARHGLPRLVEGEPIHGTAHVVHAEANGHANGNGVSDVPLNGSRDHRNGGDAGH